MYVENLKDDFYEFLSGKRILLMVHYDIDSICACKILQNLLKYKDVLYTISVVKGLDDLKLTYRENCNDVKFFILINCGGTVNILDTFEAEEDSVFFIIDSHRPTHLDNIYSDGQVRLLWTPEEDLDVPQFSEVYRDDSDAESGSEEEDDENEDESEGRAAKKRRLNEEAILKRRERRLWEEKRFDILAEYTQYSYYEKASAIAMFKLAWLLNKDDKELLWLAIVAITEQYLLGKIENTTYVLVTGDLQGHSNRLRNRSSDSEMATSVKISYEKDLKLVLYRHWNVESSLKYSMFTACKMKLWSHRGSKKLYELLADMGLPLAQSQQAFESMDLQLRKEFQESLEKVAEKYNLEDLVFASFILQYGYRNKYSASDVVYAMLAVLESKEKSEEGFNLALDCLAKNKKEVLNKAMDQYKVITRTIFKTVQGAIDMKQIITAGSFVYYIVQEGSLDWHMFSNQHILLLLAQFILRAYVSMSRNRKAPDLPLIISAPKNLEKGTCLILGIPPLRQSSPKNNLGRAFEEAAENINYEVLSDYFDTSYFEVFVKDRTRFFDALTALFDK